MKTIATVGAVLLATVACGGGGSSSPPPIEVSFDLALVRADAASTRTITIENPLESEASVDLIEPATGPVFPKQGELPGVAALDGVFALRVVVTPGTPGALIGRFSLRFTGPGGHGEREVDVTITAIVETPSIVLDTPDLAFGSVRIGESRTLDLTVRNASQLTSIGVDALSALPAGFRYGGVVVPATLAPGALLKVPVIYEPEVLGAPSFSITVEHSIVLPVLVAAVSASTDTWVPEMITDFGQVPLVGGETGWLEVEVPPHGVSLSLEAVGSVSSVPGLLGLEGPGGRIYENAQATGAFFWTPGSLGVFTATVPNNDRSEVQLVSGGGTYRFRFFLLAGSDSFLKVRAIVHNRPGGVVTDGRLNLNIFLAPALGLTATSAPQTQRVQEIVSRIDEIYSQQGLRLGAVSYFELLDPTYDDVTSAEFPDLLRESAVAPEVRLNLFFVRTALGGGVLGVAARIPGPALNGTGVSGVMMDYDFGTSATAGYVGAHEIGHFLGLFHTVESNGAHDMMDDTVECPPSGTSTLCPIPGNGYLMHWQVLSSEPVITDGQGRVMLGHPLVQPLSGLAALALAPPPQAPVAPGGPLPAGWCGTPACRFYIAK